MPNFYKYWIPKYTNRLEFSSSDLTKNTRLDLLIWSYFLLIYYTFDFDLIVEIHETPLESSSSL